MSELMKMLNPAWSRVRKRLRYPFEAILSCVRWYVVYPRSLRHLQEMTAERGMSVDKAGDTVDCLLLCGALWRAKAIGACAKRFAIGFAMNWLSICIIMIFWLNFPHKNSPR